MYSTQPLLVQLCTLEEDMHNCDFWYISFYFIRVSVTLFFQSFIATRELLRNFYVRTGDVLACPCEF